MPDLVDFAGSTSSSYNDRKSTIRNGKKKRVTFDLTSRNDVDNDTSSSMVNDRRALEEQVRV